MRRRALRTAILIPACVALMMSIVCRGANVGASGTSSPSVHNLKKLKRFHFAAPRVGTGTAAGRVEKAPARRVESSADGGGGRRMLLQLNNVGNIINSGYGAGGKHPRSWLFEPRLLKRI